MRFSFGQVYIAVSKLPLCNAHAFESAHPQSYVIAHTLPVCRFEVNFLHINPIIGQIWLIYIHFQQKFPYFSNYVTFYCAEICLPTAYFTSSQYILKHGFPKFGLFLSKHPAGFHYCESAHPQSYVIAHTLPVCRFEVNFLHINPIIGQIWLIYIHFQ